MLLGGNYKIPQEKVDIVIAYNMEDEIPISFKTLLDLKKKTVIGPVEKIEKNIIEFFRRRGIRVFET